MCLWRGRSDSTPVNPDGESAVYSKEQEGHVEVSVAAILKDGSGALEPARASGHLAAKGVHRQDFDGAFDAAELLVDRQFCADVVLGESVLTKLYLERHEVLDAVGGEGDGLGSDARYGVGDGHFAFQGIPGVGRFVEKAVENGGVDDYRGIEESPGHGLLFALFGAALLCVDGLYRHRDFAEFSRVAL